MIFLAAEPAWRHHLGRWRGSWNLFGLWTCTNAILERWNPILCHSICDVWKRIRTPICHYAGLAMFFGGFAFFATVYQVVKLTDPSSQWPAVSPCSRTCTKQPYAFVSLPEQNLNRLPARNSVISGAPEHDSTGHAFGTRPRPCAAPSSMCTCTCVYTYMCMCPLECMCGHARTSSMHTRGICKHLRE